MRFQSTPSAWRETAVYLDDPVAIEDFNPLPPHGGRLRDWKAFFRAWEISIHSLRMEGDQCSPAVAPSPPHFNPLPPHGGRLPAVVAVPEDSSFQSTPSAWRETAKLHRKAFFISPILVQSCKKGCKRLHSAPEKMVFFEKREKNLVRNLQHLSVRL